MSTRRKIFYGVTVATLLVLVLLPGTRSLMRQQLLPVYPGNKTGVSYVPNEDDNAEDIVFHRIAMQHPTDFMLQYAIAVYPEFAPEQVRRLEKLRETFPHELAIPAAILRMNLSNCGAITLERSEVAPLRSVGDDPDSPYWSDEDDSNAAPVPLTAEELAELAHFDAIAAEGESQEPGNAYFTAMRAIGYFAARQDDKALAAWKRAASKPIWNDYADYGIKARIHLLETINGGSEIGFLLRSAIDDESFYDDDLQVAAQMAVVRAVEAELAGNREEGYALRKATRQIGEKMVTQGRLENSNRIGATILNTPTFQPGGITDVKNTGSGLQSRRIFAQEMQAKYIGYLTRIGHPEEAAAFLAAFKEGETVRTVSRNATRLSYLHGGPDVFRLLFCWLGNGLLLMAALLSIAFADLFGAIFRFSPRLQRGEPLQTSARWGITATLLSLTATLPTRFLSEKYYTTPSWVFQCLFAALVLISLIIPPIVLRLTRREIGHGLLICLATFGTVGLLIRGMQFCSGLFPGAETVLDLVANRMSEAKDFSGLFFAVGITLILLPLPFSMLSLLALFCRILRIPVASGVTRGMRAMGVPLACILIFGYAACLLATLRYENAAIAAMKKTEAMGELQAYADSIGEPMTAR